jgi:hypothetical protein
MVTRIPSGSQSHSEIRSSRGHAGSSLIGRVPHRSMCHVQELALATKNRSPRLSNFVVPAHEHPYDDRRISVARFPAPNRNCVHQVFAELGTQLKKLDLPSTSRVEVRQRFRAQAGDRLSFDYVVLLKLATGVGPNTLVRALLVRLATRNAHSLLHSTVGGWAKRERRVMSGRNAVSFRISDTGLYELRITTSVDQACPGAESHLSIDRVRLIDHTGLETNRLASLNCVGRVPF